MNTAFAQALAQHDLSALRRIPKGDLHNHAPRGGNITDIEAWAGKIPRLTELFTDLGQMQAWYEANIKCHCIGLPGYDVRIRAAFRQARRDGVTKLVLTFGLGEEALYGPLENFITAIHAIRQQEAPEVDLIPELALGSDWPAHDLLFRCEACFASGYFKSIDINGQEMVQPPATFKTIYRLAKSYGLTLRAHVGEFGTADDVRRAVEVLELDEVQHGNAAASDASIMRYLADNHIRLNLCPASNILLSRAKDYKTHPIRTLYDAGIKVTINTDDMLIFDVDLSEMFLHFYQDGVFTPEELNNIRMNALDF